MGAADGGTKMPQLVIDDGKPVMHVEHWGDLQRGLPAHVGNGGLQAGGELLLDALAPLVRARKSPGQKPDRQDGRLGQGALERLRPSWVSNFGSTMRRRRAVLNAAMKAAAPTE